MQALRIILLCTALAVIYGILHDLVTAHICVEYFSVAHPPVFPTNNPTLLALGWGVLATWWVGLALGLLLAACARVGAWPRISARQLLPLILLLLGVMALLATGAGLLAFHGAREGRIHLSPQWSLYARIPPAKRAAFLADAAAHDTAYATSFVGGLTLATMTVLRRRRAARGR